MANMSTQFNPREHLTDLKGKQNYLTVPYRVHWFREEKPDYQIFTEILVDEPARAVFRCTISNPEGRILATGHGSETKNDFGDFFEKAETKSIGRALAALGYGTTGAKEFSDEGMLADSPLEVKLPAAELPTIQEAPVEARICGDCGSEIHDSDFEGKTYTAELIFKRSMNKYGRCLCMNCLQKANSAMNQAAESDSGPEEQPKDNLSAAYAYVLPAEIKGIGGKCFADLVAEGKGKAIAKIAGDSRWGKYPEAVKYARLICDHTGVVYTAA